MQPLTRCMRTRTSFSGQPSLTHFPEVHSVEGRELAFVADAPPVWKAVRMQQLKDALHAFVDSLAAEEQIHDYHFRNQRGPVRDSLVLATPEMKVGSRAFRGSAGRCWTYQHRCGTEGSRRKQYTNNVKSAIVFLTDGEPTWGETNTDSILARMRRENTNDVRIFPVGIGDDLEITLLEQIAQQTGGTLTLVTSSDSIALTVRALVKRLFSPALANAALDYGQLFPLDIYPPSLSTAFGGEQIIQTGRFQHAAAGSVKLTGTSRIRHLNYRIASHSPTRAEPWLPWSGIGEHKKFSTCSV